MQIFFFFLTSEENKQQHGSEADSFESIIIQLSFINGFYITDDFFNDIQNLAAKKIKPKEFLYFINIRKKIYIG